MLDDSICHSGDTVFYEDKKRTLYYFAENKCGRSSSMDSYFYSCMEIDTTLADSIKAVGSLENVKLLRRDDLKMNSSIDLDVHKRFSTGELLLTTEPSDPSRIWVGDDAKLEVVTNYKPSRIDWYQVAGVYDARFGNLYDIYGNLVDSLLDVNDEVDVLLASTDSTYSRFKELDLTYLTDSAMYYAVVSDRVCPAWSTNVAHIDVVFMIPTAITPFDKDGLNDVFLERYPVVIFNRYGQRIHAGIGWDGTSGGQMVDPGVYYYEADMPGGNRKGSIEVVKIR